MALAWLPDHEIEAVLDIVTPRRPSFSRLEPANVRSEL
jgi:hypothetical protein